GQDSNVLSLELLKLTISRLCPVVTAWAIYTAFETIRWFSRTLMYMASTYRNSLSCACNARFWKASISGSIRAITLETNDLDTESPHNFSSRFGTLRV